MPPAVPPDPTPSDPGLPGAGGAAAAAGARSGGRSPDRAPTTAESTAAGIYGVIVSAAVMASSHADGAGTVAVAVLVTLVVYWAAERYARVLAERLHDRRGPTRAEVREQLTSGWEIVSASTLPLLVLFAVDLLGADVQTAVLAALTCSTVLLGLAGWAIGRHGDLRTWERAGSAAVAAAFGVAMIALKALLH